MAATQRAYQRRQQAIFPTVHTEGAILPLDLLQLIADPQHARLEGLTPDAYHLSAEKLNEAINRSWNRVLIAWQHFNAVRAKLAERETGTTPTRERWLLPLFNELGYGRLLTTKSIVIGERSYSVSHSWHHTPIHLVGCGVRLDYTERSESGVRRSSPHSLVQELLNRSDEYLWGIVSNGLVLRILRDNVSLTRQAYVEFDLEAMMNGEIYADFVLLWLLCHQSRVEAERPTDCWLEKWSRMAHENGTRALDQLRGGVERAITALGSGFLAHRANSQLRDRLQSGQLNAQEYYRQVLRLVYRLIVLFVAEDRRILFHPDASPAARDLYTRYYSTARLRYLAEQHIGTRHADLYCGLRLVMEKLGHIEGYPELGLPALNGFLFSHEAVADLTDCELANHYLLDAIRSLAFLSDKHTRRVVDYKNLGSEELGSVYESLLELHPKFNIESASFELVTASGNERKTTGSYYTPTSLITCLLDSALDPVLAEACAQPDAEAAILGLKICDPACGSGHFIVAAAHRIAKRLAAIRTGEEEPSPDSRRTALRDVVGHCIYGVDINPMSVELCKVSLWMEAIDPGKPLSFLDAHIQHGNSLLGTTPALLQKGIPESAFEPIEGDDRKYCSDWKKHNKKQREGQLNLFDEDMQPWNRQEELATSRIEMEQMSDSTATAVRRKQEHYYQLMASDAYENSLFWANAWCAAFVWKKTRDYDYPITENIFRKIEKNPGDVTAWMKEEINRLAAQYQFFHWHLAFPDVFRVPTGGETPENAQAGWSGGFDVVLGNPPWEHTELKEQEWFVTRDSTIALASGAERKRKIEALAIDNPELSRAFLEARRQGEGWSHFIRHSEHYPLCGRGRINTYAIFSEALRWIVRDTGHVGCIVPSGIATDDTTKLFFQNILDERSLVSFYDFDNTAGIFPAVDNRVKFCLLTLAGSAQPAREDATFAFFLHQPSDLQSEESSFTLSARDIALINPNTRTCPIFRSRRDAKLTKRMYQRFPILLRDDQTKENPWSLTFRQGMFNMTSDSHLFRTHEQLQCDGWMLQGNTFYKADETYYPLYEGKMIHHFDHRFHSYQTFQDTYELDATQHNDPQRVAQPRYWVHQSQIPNIYGKNLLAFRDITNATNVRTAIFCIIPIVACGNNLPIALNDSEYTHELTFLSASTSSYVFDYVARQKVGGTHLNFFILKQLPVLPPSQYIRPCQWSNATDLGTWIWPRTLELTYTASDLEPFARDCGYNGPPFRWDEARRFLLRCELDAAYFHLYGIARDDVDYIMETFPIVKRKDEKQHGEYRTKRVILEIYDEMQRAMETGKAYQTRLDPPPADPSVAHSPMLQ